LHPHHLQQEHSCKIQPTTRLERAARSPAAKLGFPEANALLRTIERSFAGGKSATAAICDTIREMPDPKKRQAAKPEYHGLKIRRDAVEPADRAAREREYATSIAPADRAALTAPDVSTIPTTRGHGTSHPETLLWWYAELNAYGRDPGLREDMRRHYTPQPTSYAASSHHDDALTADDTAAIAHGIDTRDMGDQLHAEEESLAGLGVALHTAPSWLTAGVLLAWLAGDVCPKHLARCKALPSDKTITAHLTAACKRFAEWRQAGVVTAEQIEAGRQAVRRGSPLLAAITAHKQRKADLDHANRMRGDIDAAATVRSIEMERQAAITPADREAWRGERGKVAPLPRRSSGHARAQYKVAAQKRADQRDLDTLKFVANWMAANEHKLPREIEPEKKIRKKSQTAPLAAQIPLHSYMSKFCSAPLADHEMTSNVVGFIAHNGERL
jgi:hypothetical protein